MPTFNYKVKQVVRKIPRGQVCTYAEVARRAGNPRAARAVGAIMRANRDPQIPCHRVVRSDGTMGGYNRGGERAKRKLLRAEGAWKFMETGSP
jgi:O-6-methylguanine DNA methyltransferase